MKKLLIVSGEMDSAPSAICETLSDQYSFIMAEDVRDAIKNLDELSDEIICVIISKPSELHGIGRLFDYMNENNTVIFSVPALVLTDEEHRKEDETYLGDPVIDIIEVGDSDSVIRNRIQRSSQFLSSVSFSEFADMLTVLPSLIYLKDSRGRYVFCTQYWHHLDHYDDPDWTIRGKTDMEIRKDVENAKMAYESDMRILDSGKGASYIIEENEDGKQEYLQLIKEPLFTKEGKVKGIIALINDVTEQELLKQKLEQMSLTDELTGICNRTYFENYVRNVSNEIYPLSIISADCDNLKQVNDYYGHMVGDEYIRMSVTLMRSVLPDDAIICRIGGDEFVAFLPGVPADSAQRYINMLNEMDDVFMIRDRKLSISFGVCTTNGLDIPIEECIRISDDNMYRCKKEKKRKAGQA